MPEFKPKRVIRPGDEFDSQLQSQIYKYTKHYVENLYFGPDPNEDQPQAVFKGARIIRLDNKYAPQILKGSQLKIYPYTIVNLLGKYGDFETDSNGDGLADGWTAQGSTSATYSLSTGLLGKAQEYIATGSNLVWEGINKTVMLPTGHTFFLRAYKYIFSDFTGTSSKITGYNDQEGILAHYYFDVSQKSKWQLGYCKGTNTADTIKVISEAYYRDPSGNTSATVHEKIDLMSLYDLTALGQLPPPLQDLYGVTNWSDLDEDTLAQLLPFCNGICTLGFTWEGDL